MSQQDNGNRITTIILASLVGVLFLSTSLLAVDKYLPIFSPIATSSAQVDYLIENNYLGDKPTKEKLEEMRNKAVVAALEDPYSVYFTEDEAKDFYDSLNEQYVGIGVRFDTDLTGRYFIAEVFDGSGARDSGIQVGDELIKVGGKSIEEFTNFEELASQIKGDEGTGIKLTFLRNGRTFDLDITRKTVSIDNVTVDYQDSVAVIKINSFGENVGQLMKTISQEIAAKKDVKSIVIDLRNNGGGLLEQAVEVISYFVEEGKVVITEKEKENTVEHKSIEQEIDLSSYKLAVVINNYSASASEIVAAALQELALANVVGQTSFGKGVVQQLYELDNGAQLKLTVSRWLTPNGKVIDKIGVVPNTLVDEKENSLDKAIELVK